MATTHKPSGHTFVVLHSVGDTSDCLAVHSGFTLVAPSTEAADEAHLVVIGSRDLLSAADTPQGDVGQRVRDTAGDDGSTGEH